MTTHEEKVLQRVRALIAKAQSTEFEEERITFMAKADELMEKYTIDRAMAMQKDDPNVRLVVRRNMDVSWWRDMKDIDRDSRNEIYWLWQACVRHCRCVTPGFGEITYGFHEDGRRNWEEMSIPVFGTENDLNYLDMLFTDLFLQMMSKVKPKYDPNLEIGANVRLAKEAGMTWDQILDWSGLRGTALGKRLLPAYRKYCEAHGLPQVKINPKTYQWSFVSGFTAMIRTRLQEMRRQREGAPGTGESTALVLRDIQQQAQDAMWDDFPHLKPHPADCLCEACKASAKRKPVKYRSRTYSYLADAQGRQAGQDARIVSNDPNLARRKELS